MSTIRTERSHGLQERLNGSERASLVQIRHMPGYEVLLDMMEKACIEQETRLINTPVANARKIVAEHRMSKAFWQVFTSFQRQVETEINIHLGLQAEESQRKASEDEDPDQQLLRP
jgi:hypothetical protein